MRKGDNIFKNLVPFLVLLFGGSIGLTEFTKLKYNKTKSIEDDEDLAERYKQKKMMEVEKNVTLMSIINQNKNLAKQEWDNIRGPPPDVNSEQYQKEIRRKIQEEKEAKLRLEQETNKS